MTINKTILLNTDSYKFSQFNQLPRGINNNYSYIESRGGVWNQTVFFGLQMLLKEYFVPAFTQDDIDYAEELILEHGEPFNRPGFEYILHEHGGKLPLRIKAPPEGSIIPTKNVLVTAESTDPKCAWLTGFVEPPLLRGVWYPTTVATNSYESKRIIMDYLNKTGDPKTIEEKVLFTLHDFGARGVSSFESAGIGGLSHLVNFRGTDTVTALLYGREFYNCRMAGFSIPAMEHSTVTSWGRKGEEDSYRNMVKLYGKPGSLFACVSDSYNIYDACHMWGTVLKDDVINSGATLVVRPDSGYPPEVVVKCLDILESHYGHTVNEKGFKVLNHVRVIQGDGITQDTIDRILYRAMTAGYSADNIAFGQGGKLLQSIDRDTQKFAMKCSSIEVNGEQRDVYKSPITDMGKESKKGRVTLYRNDEGYFTDLEGRTDAEEVLETVFENGEIVKEYTFDEVRQNASVIV
jgi:nicotinamide phosphoribosyltransferase